MPIEKLGDVTKQLNCYNDASDICITFTNKINELIDAYNTREQDRSEQMARIIVRFERMEREVVLYHKALISLKHKFEDAEYDKNATQPKEEERSTLGQFFHDMKKEEESNDISDCPFCDDFCYLIEGEGRYYIECKKCMVSSRYFSDDKEAIRFWNRRA